MRDYLKGRKCMVWSFMGNARMYQALRDYGDRLDTVGIFTFSVDATGTLSETGTAVSSILPYISKWPHIKWMLTIMNDGIASIFTALRENTNFQRYNQELLPQEWPGWRAGAGTRRLPGVRTAVAAGGKDEAPRVLLRNVPGQVVA